VSLQEIQRLANRLFDSPNKLVVLACAGLSMGCPTEFHGGAELVGVVISGVRGEFAEFWDYQGNDIGVLFDAIIAARADHGKLRFIDAIVALGPDYYPTNDAHRILVKLYLEGAIESIYTLNVDTLFEKCAQDLILNNGWPEASGLHGTFGTHSFACRWGHDKRQGPGSPVLNKIHGCISRDPYDTIWSASALARSEWPATVSWARRAFEHDVQENDLLVVGCGARVHYVNESVRAGRAEADGARTSYLVSPSTYEAYRDHINPDLLANAGIPQAHFFSSDAADFFRLLHSEFCKRFLSELDSRLSAQVDRVAERDAEESSIFRTERDELKQSIREVVARLKQNTEIVERLMRRSLLWGRDVSEHGIALRYVPLRSNEEIVMDIIECAALLKLVQVDLSFDENQVAQTLTFADGRGLLVVHCRSLTASLVCTEILSRVVDRGGPVLAPDLTIVFLRAGATVQEITSIVSDRRFATTGASRTRGIGAIPDRWTLITSDETIDRARYEEAEQWRQRIRQALSRT
jgi:hypothetical protein